MDDSWLVASLLVIALLATIGVIASLVVLRSLLRESAREREVRLVEARHSAPVVCGCPRCAGLPADRSWGRA